MIGIIDYHLNNLRSVQKAFEKVGVDSFISDKPEELLRADKLVLPGVGAFGEAMKNLRELNLIDVVTEHAKHGKPLLGICLGMQLLFSKSFELGENDGLNFISGDIALFPATVKIPHIGWNQIEFQSSSPMLKNVENKSFVYFVHSYYASPKENVTLSTTEYGFTFSSIVQKGNIVGIQFHPEKSQSVGLILLKNFSEL
jgi:imidazole glycerol-phosphate synthase subunit HisH